MLDRCRPLWKNSTDFLLFSRLQLTVTILRKPRQSSTLLQHNISISSNISTLVLSWKKKEKRSPNVQLISSVASQQSIFLSHLFSNGRQEVSLLHWKCVSRLQTEKERVVLDSIASYLLRVLCLSVLGERLY